MLLVPATSLFMGIVYSVFLWWPLFIALGIYGLIRYGSAAAQGVWRQPRAILKWFLITWGASSLLLALMHASKPFYSWAALAALIGVLVVMAWLRDDERQREAAAKVKADALPKKTSYIRDGTIAAFQRSKYSPNNPGPYVGLFPTRFPPGSPQYNRVVNALTDEEKKMMRH